MAVVRVLEHLGHEVIFPERQTCCGQPMYNNGYHDEARKLALQLIDIFRGYSTIVTPSGSCAAMIREYYPSLFEAGSVERKMAEDLGSRTYEFVEFLTRIEKADLSALGVEWKGDVTYHYSCHLRGLGISRECVDLAQQINGLNYTELDKIDQCCGFGGTFCLKYPTISGSMVQDKVECIRRTEAPTVICNDAGCAMNIAGACRRQEVDVELKSLAEIIAEGLGLMDREEAAR